MDCRSYIVYIAKWCATILGRYMLFSNENATKTLNELLPIRDCQLVEELGCLLGGKGTKVLGVDPLNRYINDENLNLSGRWCQGSI